MLIRGCLDGTSGNMVFMVAGEVTLIVSGIGIKFGESCQKPIIHHHMFQEEMEVMRLGVNTMQIKSLSQLSVEDLLIHHKRFLMYFKRDHWQWLQLPDILSISMLEELFTLLMKTVPIILIMLWLLLDTQLALVMSLRKLWRLKRCGADIDNGMTGTTTQAVLGVMNSTIMDIAVGMRL